MQISDSVRYVDAGAETAAQEHPVGEVTFGTGGALGLRSRLLRTADREAAVSIDMPFTTGTITLS
jgi:hypothetical protein